MNKGKFASLILLGAFSAGVASSSAVSAQGDINLASTVDISIGSHDESAVAFDETNIDAETTTDEETKNAITDENNDARDDTENLYVFVADDKKQNVKKSKGVGKAEGLAVAGGGAIMVGSATSGISKLVKSSKNDKKDEPKPEPEPDPEPKSEPEPKPEPKPDPEPKPEPNKKEEKGGFGAWYINNLLISLPVTFVVGYIFVAIIFAIRDFAFNRGKGDTRFHYAPLRGRFKTRTVEVGRSIPRALWYEFLSALILSYTEWDKPKDVNELII